jgi:lipopolysaccharide cholinephosphotransferase
MKKSHFDKAVGRKNLIDTRDLLEGAGVPMFLHWGTLLGAVRERDFIPHDNDIDVGFFLSDLDRFLGLKNAFQAQGFEFITEGIRNREDGYIYKVIRDEVDIDLFPAREVRSFLKGRLWQLDERTTVPPRFLDSLEAIEFLGETFKVPADPIGLMRNLYGKTWNVPIADYPARVDWMIRIRKLVTSPLRIPFYVGRFITKRTKLRADGRRAGAAVKTGPDSSR